jgi:hypothetical protein
MEQYNKAKYNFSNCNSADLNEFFNLYNRDATSDRACLKFADLMIQARIKTRTDYDREIGRIVRGEEQPPYGVNYWDWKAFIDLVNASKEAPEE